MRLACVLTGCTIDRTYLECLPLFIRTWRKLYPEVKVKVVFVDETLPEEIEPYREHIIHFPPVEDVPVGFTSQYVRLLYPALLGEEGGVMVADVDVVPMNRRYFSDSIRRFADDAFVSYQKPYRRLLRWRNRFADDGVTKLEEPENRAGTFPQIYLPHNVANSKVWGEIFGVRTMEDVAVKLRNTWKRYYGKTNVWYIDQIDLFHAVKAWDLETRRHVCVPGYPWMPLFLHLPRYASPELSLRSKPNGFFSVLLRFCIQLEFFSWCATLRSDDPSCKIKLRGTLSCREVNEKAIGSLSSRPLPGLITPFRILMLLILRGMTFTSRLIKRQKRLLTRLPLE